VDAPSAITSPREITSPFFTIGRWLMLVFWLLRVVLDQVVDVDATSPAAVSSSFTRTTIRFAST